MTGFTFTSECIPDLDLSSSINTSLIYFTSNKGKSSKSALSVIAAISPLVQELIPPCYYNNLHDHHLLLPQVEEVDVALLLQFVKIGTVTTSLRLCTRLLEILKMFGVNTSNIVLEKVTKIVNEQNDSKDDEIGEKEDSDDEELNIVYEGQSNNIPRADIVSFIQVKPEVDNMLDSSTSDVLTCRGRLTPLLTPTPPPPSSCLSTSSLQWQEVVSLGMARRLELRGKHMTSLSYEDGR